MADPNLPRWLAELEALFPGWRFGRAGDGSVWAGGEGTGNQVGTTQRWSVGEVDLATCRICGQYGLSAHAAPCRHGEISYVRGFAGRGDDGALVVVRRTLIDAVRDCCSLTVRT